MTAMLTAPASTEALPELDWAEFYRGLQARANIPNASITEIDGNHGLFQALYLDLNDIKLALAHSGFNPPLVTIVADVLNVPEGAGWSLSGAVLQIQARRVQTSGDFQVTLDYRTSGTASLTLYCAELAGRVRAVAVRAGSDPVVLLIDEPSAAGGTQALLADGTPVKRDVSWAQGIPFQLPHRFEQSMRTEFIAASLLYNSHPALAISQYTWLKNWTGYDDELLGVFLQSCSLLALLSAQLNATQNGSMFVPYLTRTVYEGTASAYVAEARQYESDFRALQTQQTVDDQFIKLAKTLLANKTYESDYANALLAQAERNYENAAAATDAAYKTLSDAQLKAKLIAIDFEKVGVPEWQREQIVKAVIELCTAVVTFAVGIGAMLAGDPAGGGAAAGAAIEGAKAAAEAAQAGSEIAKLAKQLQETMEKLKKIGEALAKVYELASTVVKVVGDIQDAKSYVDRMREMSASLNGADLTAGYEWQVYQQASDASLQGPVDLGIEFAADLKLAVDTVAVYGQALAAAQVAAINAGQAYASVSLQVQLAKRQQDELQRYVDSLVKGEVPTAALMQRFYELYLNAKSGLFTAIQGYRASYYYWALLPSSINPSIVDGVDGLDTGLKNLTGITLDFQTALEHFDPPPQLLTDKQVAITDPVVLQALAKSGEARWVVPADTHAFAGFDRVRLNKVRVWLDGARVTDGGSVSVLMSTQGNYLDRFKGKSYQFTSKPLIRDFTYRVTSKQVGSPDWRFPDGSLGYVEVDGVVDDEVSYAYFQPTPFGEWHVSVTGDGLDLSGVTRVVMQFAGSVISHT
jgi:hypothetical protein